MPTLISIVIPVYNRADIIGRTVESCLAQTYQPIEIVLVDDCSKDALDGALRPFVDDPRVRLVRHEVNRGVSAARNSGVQAAKGALIAFLDSDDIWQPTKLERQMALIDAHQGDHDGDRYLCATLTDIRADDGTSKVRPKRLKPRGVPLGDYLFVDKVQRRLPLVSYNGAPLKGGCFAQTSAYVLPRPLALATPFRETLSQYEDMAFLIDLDAKSIDFLLVEEPLTIQYDDNRPGRLGARDDLARGHCFLEAIGEKLSPEATLAFEATHLAHLHGRDRPFKMLSLVFRAFAKRAIAPKSVLGILFRCFFGQGGQQALRGVLFKGQVRAKNGGAA